MKKRGSHNKIKGVVQDDGKKTRDAIKTDADHTRRELGNAHPPHVHGA